MKKTFTYKNRTFDVYGHRYGTMLFEFSVYEVIRPAWKIFRSGFFPLCCGWFFIDDYPSIEDGIKERIAHVLQEEIEEVERNRKVNEYFKDTY